MDEALFRARDAAEAVVGAERIRIGTARRNRQIVGSLPGDRNAAGGGSVKRKAEASTAKPRSGQPGVTVRQQCAICADGLAHRIGILTQSALG